MKETLNEIRITFWVPKARNFIQQRIRGSSICKKYDTCSYKYPVNQTELPNLTVTCEPPFTSTSIDYAGPWFIQNIDGRSKTYKAWIFLFTRSATRGICLELLSSYNASACIRGLIWFCGRRGTWTSLLSDNGSDFTDDKT